MPEKNQLIGKEIAKKAKKWREIKKKLIKRALFIGFESFRQCSRLLWRIMLFAIDYLNVNKIIMKKIILKYETKLFIFYL